MSTPTRRRLLHDLQTALRGYQRAVDALDAAAAVHLGVHRTDLRGIDLVLQEGSTTAGRLAVELGLTSGSVTALLDRLEHAGYLTRAADPQDRRRVVVRPTPAVEAAVARIYAPLAEAGTQDTARYTPQDFARLITFFKQGRRRQEEQLAVVRDLSPTE